LGGLVALGLLALVFRGLDWAALGEAFRRAHWGYLAVVALLTVVMYTARAWRWRYLLQPLADVPLSRAFSATTVGFMAGLVIPRAQEVLRPYLVARRHKLRTAAAFASIIVERLLDLITVLILFGLHLFVFSDRAARAGQPLMAAVEKGGALAAVGALGVLVVLFAFHWRAEALLALAERLLARLPARLAGPFLGLLRSFGEGLAIFKASPGHLLAIVGQSLLVWLLIAASLQAANLAFDVRLPFHATFLMLGFLTVGVAVPTPGMVGGFHAAYVVALVEAFGVSRETATAAAVAAHALTNLPVLVMGLACLPAEGLTLGRVASLTEEKAA
jgi:uncharacterized protein (TIRG00374 family)